MTSTLPSGWVEERLGNVMTVIRGASPRPKGDPRYFGGNIPWISIRDITAEPGRYLTRTREGVTEAGAELSRLLPAGTLVLSNSGTVCVPKILSIEGCIHDGFVSFLNVPKGLDLLYLYECFNWMRPDVVSRHRQGMTQVNLNTEIVNNFVLPIAPAKEQLRIVDALDTQLTRLDDAMRSLERVQRNLTRYRASVLKAAVEGRLVPTEAELARAEKRDYEPAEKLLERILAERRRRWEEAELAKMKASGKAPGNDGWKCNYPEPVALNNGNLPELPEGWCWATVDMVGDILLGRQRAPQYLTGKHYRPYLRVANIKDDRIDFSDIEEMDFDEAHFTKYRLQSGDILVSEGQTPDLVGQSAIYRGQKDGLCFQKTLHRFRPFVPGPTPEFAQLVFRAHVKTGYFKTFASITTNIAHFTLEKFRSSRFPLPPAAEQARIVESADKVLTVSLAQDKSVKAAELRCARLRQSILKWAFEGKLADQDPSDEPASIILDRIRSERAAASADKVTPKKSPARKPGRPAKKP